MKKQIGCWVVGCILAAVLAFTALPVFGESTAEEETVYTCDGYSYVLQEDGTAKIVFGLPRYVQEVERDPDKGYFVDENGMRLVLRLPEELDGFTVTAVASEAFDDIVHSSSTRDKMRGVDVHIPNTLINMEPGVFDFGEVHSFIVEADHPKYMTIGNALMEKDTMRLVAYGREVGQNTIIVPEGTKIIGERAFSNLSCYQTMLQYFPYKYSSYDRGLADFGGAFPCDCFTEVVLPRSLTQIEAEAFLGCCSLNNVVIPDGVASLGNEAFYMCISLDSIAFSSNLKEIGEYCFFGCSLKEIILPESLEKVGDGAIGIGLCVEKLHIPSGLTEVTFYDSAAFVGIGSNRKVIRLSVAEDNPVLACVDGALINKQENKLICYFGEEGVYSYTVPEEVTSIAEIAFYGCDWLKEIVVPDTVTRIGECAFSECDVLEKLTLPVSCIDALSAKQCISHSNMLSEIRISNGWTKEQMAEQEEQLDAALIIVNNEMNEEVSARAAVSSIVPPVLTVDEFKKWSESMTSKARMQFQGSYSRMTPSRLEKMKNTEEERKRRDELLAFCPALETTELYLLNIRNERTRHIDGFLREVGFTEKDYKHSLNLCNWKLGTYYYVGDVETSCEYDLEKGLFYPLVHIVNGEKMIVLRSPLAK